MKTTKWLAEHTSSLAGKTVAVTGSTGGLGQSLCRVLAALGADLVLLDRNPKKAEAADARLLAEYPTLRIKRISLDLERMETVRAAAEALRALPLDVLILNAGAYSIPRHTCENGLDNVFQINCAAPYYLVRELLPLLRARRGRVVAVGSIAHRYSESDSLDVDFSQRRKASLVYGNAKRCLMASLIELFAEEREASLAVVHPGITFTNITSHYPKLIFALIKHPMKLIFMPTDRAVLSTVQGIFDPCCGAEWIGPRLLDIWGLPKKRPLRSIPERERRELLERAEEIYRKEKETE